MIPPSGGCCFLERVRPLAEAAFSRTIPPSGGGCSLSNDASSGGCCSISGTIPHSQNMMLKSMVWLSHQLPLTFDLPFSLVVSGCLSASSIATMSPVLM